MSGFCNVWLCVCVEFVMCRCAYVWVLKCVLVRVCVGFVMYVGVFMCGFCNLCVCLCRFCKL